MEPTEFICRPCWQRAERSYQRLQRERSSEVADNEEERPNEVPEPLNEGREST